MAWKAEIDLQDAGMGGRFGYPRVRKAHHSDQKVVVELHTPFSPVARIWTSGPIKQIGIPEVSLIKKGASLINKSHTHQGPDNGRAHVRSQRSVLLRRDTASHASVVEYRFGKGS